MNKLTLIAPVALFIIALGLWLCNSSLHAEVDSLNAQLVIMRMERDIAMADVNSALEEIDRQNSEIAALAVNRDLLYSELTQLRAKSAITKTEYIERLVMDSGCENQLHLIKEAQGAFYESGN